KNGTVYVVAGSAGQVGGTQASFPHAAMSYSNATTGGSLAIEIEGNRLDAKFVAADNTIKDQFTIFKDVNKTTTMSLNTGQSATLTASWVGNYNWSTGATTQSITVSPVAGNNTYYVNDNTAAKCLSDTFNVNFAAATAIAKKARSSSLTPKTGSDFSFKVYPNPAKGGAIHLTVTTEVAQNIKYVIEDMNGRIIHNKNMAASPGATHIKLNVPPGVYVLKLSNVKGIYKTEKIALQ
ncbi:MAG TPA: T9SS type A sorting domain-containing protein, partial [Niastella sp.]|nr:T9SS type A sorting domain-containing protein [Niastella sp.]